ncbi:hypothetical protein GGI15_004841 [Coemansia interrupta]|uniref:Diphthine--ammonia ligase n=1 Tax=Coemansia interrupta TaxID=1126814 RepID=A0A9W8H587_9FUNG|nr:hypothetical protein GGI15_004841 [Coemansia interrupta]
MVPPPPTPPPRAAVAFTGGKDSVLALHLVTAFRHLHPTAQHLMPVVLVTFRPLDSTDDFKAHSQHWTALLAQSLGLPLVTKHISAPFEQSYRAAIKELHRDHQVVRLVTGDILDIGEGFMDRAVQNTGVQLVRPLWNLSNDRVLDLLATVGVEYVVTLTHLDKIPRVLSERLLGRRVTREYLLEMFEWYERTEGRDLRNEVDWVGEYGEMHSMVVDCPMFRCRVVHSGTSTKLHETPYGSYSYLVPDEIHMLPKDVSS